MITTTMTPTIIVTVFDPFPELFALVEAREEFSMRVLPLRISFSMRVIKDEHYSGEQVRKLV
ncbi:MAG: hypothetical protein LYZ70_05610 [Nitrososphaerales archaeon]|nr:hypothetical protein [Nitrososphaerales archaeon]